MFMIFFHKFKSGVERLGLHFGDPDCIDGLKKNILSPFSLNLGVDLCELFVF